MTNEDTYMNELIKLDFSITPPGLDALLVAVTDQIAALDRQWIIERDDVKAEYIKADIRRLRELRHVLIGVRYRAAFEARRVSD